jgi:hypothetical protein
MVPQRSMHHYTGKVTANNSPIARHQTLHTKTRLFPYVFVPNGWFRTDYCTDGSCPVRPKFLVVFYEGSSMPMCRKAKSVRTRKCVLVVARAMIFGRSLGH